MENKNRLPDTIKIDDVVYIRRDILSIKPRNSWEDKSWKELPELIGIDYGTRLYNILRNNTKELSQSGYKELLVSDILNMNMDKFQKCRCAGRATVAELSIIIDAIKKHEAELEYK